MAAKRKTPGRRDPSGQERRGLILATARLDDELPRLLRQRGVAHALVLRTDGESPSAIGDDEVGGYLAVRHLIDLGHRDIAGITIAEDLALVGYKNTPLSARLPTPLTSVMGPLDQFAATAIDLIVNPGAEPHIRRSMPTLIPRQSSGAPVHFPGKHG